MKNAVSIDWFIVLLLVSLMTLGNFVYLARGSTGVTGIIDLDATWTQSNGPYDLTGNVLVDQNVTLTIEPGVIVNLGDYYIMVNGTLSAIGDAGNPITFNGGQITFTEYSSDWNESTATGSTIQNSISSSSLSFNNSPKLSNNTLHNSVNIETLIGTPIVENNVIKGLLTIVGNGNISNNIITGQGLDVFGSNLIISNNTISNCYPKGISVSTNHYSAGFHWDNTTTLIEDNLIVNNTYGIGLTAWQMFIQCSPIIRNNTIAYNTDGIYLTTLFETNEPTLLYNNIYENVNYNINNQVAGDDINATFNWWGTTNTTAISESIYDYYDDFNLGTVTFVPLLDEPNPNAPTVPPEYVIPDLPSGLLLTAILMTLIAGATITRKKLLKKQN
jgi:hypothetical protein